MTCDDVIEQCRKRAKLARKAVEEFQAERADTDPSMILSTHFGMAIGAARERRFYRHLAKELENSRPEGKVLVSVLRSYREALAKRAMSQFTFERMQYTLTDLVEITSELRAESMIYKFLEEWEGKIK